MTAQRDEPEYLPSPRGWVRNQVEAIEAADDTRAVNIMGLPVVLLTMVGARSGAVRKVPLMRVEHEGRYAAVASNGGNTKHPVWHHNLRSNPDLMLQDGPVTMPMRARLLEGAEREEWWPRCVAAFPNYAQYAKTAEREIPVYVLEPR